MLCVVNADELDKIPANGPAILASNHTTNLEGPIYYALLRGRKRTALGKLELWKNPLTRFLMQVWHIIPINRAGTDRRALRRALKSLERGEFLGIAPEGTRSTDGALQRGRAGAAMIALEADVPIIPMVQWGVQDIAKNIRRFRRTRVYIAVGLPFRVRLPEQRRPTAGELRRIADEIMYQIAVIMPEDYRGYYRDLSAMSSEFIVPCRDGAI